MENEDLSAEFVARRHELFGFIYALVRNVADAEDILQEVWVRFSAAIERGVRIEKPAHWSRSTAKNLILHYWRKHSRAMVVVDSELLDLVELAFAEGPDREESELWQIRRDALSECVQTLPNDSRQLISLRYDEGNSIATIAETVQRSQGSIMMALSRIRRLLQSCIDTKVKAKGWT